MAIALSLGTEVTVSCWGILMVANRWVKKMLQAVTAPCYNTQIFCSKIKGAIMQFSKFGEKFTKNSGILRLMDDLGNALNRWTTD